MSSSGDAAIAHLRVPHPEHSEPADFEAFWRATLAEARAHAGDRRPTFTPIQTPLRTISVEDVTFAGFGGHPIRGWLLRPVATSGPLPVVIEYIGYGGGRGLPTARLFWPSAGYAYLVMDSRGQDGDTPDPGTPEISGHQPGWATQGLDDPATYYYRRLFTDAVLAAEAVTTHPAVDADRLVVGGESQGGAIALAVAGLVPSVRAAMIKVPFLCDVRHAVVAIGDETVMGYGEIRNHLSWRRDRSEVAFRTLDYFDGMHFAGHATAPARFSTGLRDRLCPPETVVAAYDRYAGPKRIAVWPFNGHEGGVEFDDLEQVEFLTDLGLTP
jgi:cephalosporin-C deacetylase